MVGQSLAGIDVLDRVINRLLIGMGLVNTRWQHSTHAGFELARVALETDHRQTPLARGDPGCQT